MNKENLKMVAVVLALLIGSLVVNNVVMTEKVAQRVVQILKRDYAPGPYQPGFDPDKVPPGSIK